jgi:hypothetical protein
MTSCSSAGWELIRDCPYLMGHVFLWEGMTALLGGPERPLSWKFVDKLPF